MFKYISEILGRFTQSQRILALLIVLLSIVLISLGPSLIKENDCNEVYDELNKQREQILVLNNKLVDVQVDSNNERIKREREISKILQMIKSDVDNCPLCAHTHTEPYREGLVKGKKING
jgi:CHASE3 domain sensor protein